MNRMKNSLIFFKKRFVKIKKVVFLRLQITDDSLAQQVEHLPFKQRVPSSSLGRITNRKAVPKRGSFSFYDKTTRQAD